MRRASWGVRIVLALLFVAAGLAKLAGGPEVVESFARLGFGQSFRIFVGTAELAGALGLLLTPLAPLAAIGLAALMLGAVASHLFVLGAATTTPALVTLALCLTVAWLERGGLRALRVILTMKGPMDGWLAGAYDRGIQAAFGDVFETIGRDILAEIRGARRVLAAGCGPGRFTVMAAEALPDTEVWGIDLADAMIALAREHAATSIAAARLTFAVADVARLPFPDGHFDVVMTTGAIKLWPDPLAGLRELHRVLAPGGRAFIVELNRDAPPAATAQQAARAGSRFFRHLFPRAIAGAMSAAEGRHALAASPFGKPVQERLLLDGCLWLLEARKADVAA